MHLVPFREVPGVFARSALSFTLPVVLLRGIFSGIFTPTEAAAVAAFWALILGCFLDASVMMLVFVALLIPSAMAVGIDLTYFDIIVTLNFMIGLIMPPYGLLLFVMASLTHVPLGSIIREVWPFVLALTSLLALLTIFPSTSLFLPRLFGYQ